MANPDVDVVQENEKTEVELMAPSKRMETANYHDLEQKEQIPIEDPAVDLDSSNATQSSAGILSNGLFFDPELDTAPSLVDSSLSPGEGGMPLTFRAVVIGSLLACLGAAIYQVYTFKPVQATVSSTFLVLVAYTLGNGWAMLFPSTSLAERKGFGLLAPILHFLNPGPFRLNEHALASMMAIAGARGSLVVQTFATQQLYYGMKIDMLTACLAIFSTTCFGCGVAGLFRSLTIYQPQVVYPIVLPTLTLLQDLHQSSSATVAKIRLFWIALMGMFLYEIIPAYIFPLLNGVNVFCLASQHASQEIIDAFTNIFGGASGNEGLGLFSLSFDWQFIGSSFLYLPSSYQVNAWIGYVLCYAAVMGIYYSNTWNALKLPILSTTIFGSDGEVYNQTAILDDHFSVNPSAVNITGLPMLTGSFIWSNIAANLAVGSLIAHGLVFLGPMALFPLRSSSTSEMRSNATHRNLSDDAPGWWYTILVFLAFFAGFTVVLRQHDYMSQTSYLIALVLGAVSIPVSATAHANLGHWLLSNHIFKMVAALILPGRPLGILYFAMWTDGTISSALHFSGQLKLGHYLRISPRVVFFTQIWGLLLGAFTSYVIMRVIVEVQRDIFVSPLGTNVWNGQVPQILNSAAVTWSLSKDLYSSRGPYFMVPLSLLLGAILTLAQYVLHKLWPKFSLFKGDTMMLPVVFMYSSLMTFGITSSVTSTIILGVMSQLWHRRHRSAYYKKSALILGTAFDGGAHTMILLLSFAVFGAIGPPKSFFQWAGNPTTGNVDYCNGNGAYDTI